MKSVNKYLSYRMEMECGHTYYVRTDGWMERHTDSQLENTISHHQRVAGYKKG